jgi:hypothetical protein
MQGGIVHLGYDIYYEGVYLPSQTARIVRGMWRREL